MCTFGVARGKDRHRVSSRASSALGQCLGGCYEAFRTDGCRDVDGHETLSREQIVLATLVDDAEVAVALGVHVRKDDVNLVALEGGLVPVVVDTNSELASPGGLARFNFNEMLSDLHQILADNDSTVKMRSSRGGPHLIGDGWIVRRHEVRKH